MKVTLKNLFHLNHILQAWWLVYLKVSKHKIVKYVANVTFTNNHVMQNLPESSIQFISG